MADWVGMVLCKPETLTLVSSSQVKSQNRQSAPVPRCWEGVLTSRFLDLVISQPSQCVSFTLLRAPVWKQHDGHSREDTRSGLCVCTYWCSHPHTRTCTTTHTHGPVDVCGSCPVCWRTSEIRLPCIPGSCLLSGKRHKWGTVWKFITEGTFPFKEWVQVSWESPILQAFLPGF